MNKDLSRDIVVIGGAGPEAGILLAKQIIRVCQKEHRCKRDDHFPHVALFSYPFCEMLQVENKPTVSYQLNKLIQEECIKAKIWVIACNTLHCYLEGIELPNTFVDLLKETAKVLKKPPVVFCSSTSRSNQIHRRYFDCGYPSLPIQIEIDRLIDDLMADEPSQAVYEKFMQLAQSFEQNQIVLGCTEFSVLNDYFPLGQNIVDPLKVIAKKLCELHFES